MSKIDEGSAAPDFALPADGGTTVTLSALQGKNVVLYFYPKDDTSGCTAESIDFSGLLPQFEAHDTVVIGLSPDSAGRHNKFKAKHNLSVTLVADEGRKTLDDYGVWVEKSMYGKKYMGVERSTFLIGADGMILKAWRKVKVPGHAAAVLDAVKALV